MAQSDLRKNSLSLKDEENNVTGQAERTKKNTMTMIPQMTGLTTKVEAVIAATGTMRNGTGTGSAAF